MNTDTRVLLRMFYNMCNYFWMITWMKCVNNVQVVKIQPQRVA